MSYIIQFLLFLIYTILIFCIKQYYLIAIVCVINIILMIITKVNIKKTFKFLLKLMPFVIFTTLINIAISGLSFGLLIGIRLLLVCNITYIYSRKVTPHQLQFVIEKLLKPLKIFGINSKDIGIMLCIAISFIPIFQREIMQYKYSLKAKGFNPTFKNIISNPTYILAPLITSLIKRVGDIEQSLLSKGYMST